MNNRLSILSNATQSDLLLAPYPYLFVENALDRDLLAQLEAEFPRDCVILGDREILLTV